MTKRVVNVNGEYRTGPSVRHIAGSVDSSKPEHIAFSTAPFSNLPNPMKKYLS